MYILRSQISNILQKVVERQYFQIPLQSPLHLHLSYFETSRTSLVFYLSTEALYC